MSRSVCTNNSSIVLMSFEKKPMTFILSWLSRDQLRCNRAFDRQRATRPGVPRDPYARMPGCRPWNSERNASSEFAFKIAARSASTLIIRLRAIGEARVAEAGPDGQDPPVLDVLHERHLA